MELDYTTVKALSSPTRVKLLRRLQRGESTPTQLSDAIGKSKSTVVSHLETLEAADLVERDAEDGRRRVTYTTTAKGAAIAGDRKRTVKFTVGSSVVSGLAGAGLAWYSVVDRVPTPGEEYKQSGGDAGVMTEDAPSAADAGTPETADPQTIVDLLSGADPVFGAAGILFLVLAAALLVYTYLFWTAE